MSNSRFTNEVTEDAIVIFYDGAEVLYWDRQEWIDDPAVVVPQIANALTLAHQRPGDLIELLKQMGRM